MKYAILLLAYLIGAIPFGYLVARIFNIDIRRHGSGNIGATNVLRTVGALPGALVFTLDLLKGAAAIYLAQRFFNDPWLIVSAGLLVVMGHLYSVFINFSGGKGAAAGLGVLLGIAPEIFLGAVIGAALIIWLTRYVSLASMIIGPAVALAFYLLGKPWPYVYLAGFVAVLLLVRHIPNIRRLLKGTEPKVGSRAR